MSEILLFNFLTAAPASQVEYFINLLFFETPLLPAMILYRHVDVPVHASTWLINIHL